MAQTEEHVHEKERGPEGEMSPGPTRAHCPGQGCCLLSHLKGPMLLRRELRQTKWRKKHLPSLQVEAPDVPCTVPKYRATCSPHREHTCSRAKGT